MGRTAVALAAMLLALAVPGPGASSSRAAVDAWNVEELRVSPAEFARHKQALALDGMALDAAEGLYLQYEQDFNDLREARKLSLDWLYSHFLSNYGTGYEPDDAIGVTVKTSEREIIGAWNEQSRALAERYFDDLALLLPVDRATTEALRRAHWRHRMRDLTAPMGGRIAGVNLDLVQVMDEVHPDWRRNDELRILMQAYETALDALLRRADAQCVTYSDRIRAASLRVKNVVGEREREAAIDACAQVVVARQEPLPLIRRLQVQSMEQLYSRLPAAEAVALQLATDRTLRSYLYDHADAAHARLRLALARRDLTDGQQQTLRAIGEALALGRAAAAARLDGLYDRSIAPDVLRRKAESWWSEEDATAVTPEEQAFREARAQWRQTERGFNRQIAAALGERWPFAEPLDPALIVEPEESAPDDSSDWLNDMFAPAIERAAIERFASSLRPEQREVASAIRNRHAQLLAEYEAEANVCRQMVVDGMASLNAMDRLASADIELSDSPELMEAIEQLHASHQEVQFQWRLRQLELADRMTSQLEAVVDDESRAAWERFRHDLRRERFLPEPDPESGAGSAPPDLARLLDRLDIDAALRARLAVKVDAYVAQIGALLAQQELDQNRTIGLQQTFWEQVNQDEQGDAVRAFLAIQTRMQETWNAIAQATRQHTDVIAAAMEPELAAAFREAIQRHRWPAAFAVSPAAWAAERLLEVGLLDEAQREAVAELLAASRAAMASLRQQIITATEQWMRPGEPERRWAEREALFAAGDDPSSAFFGHRAIDMLKRRMRQEEDDRSRLRGLLRADQLEHCPPGVQLVLETEP